VDLIPVDPLDAEIAAAFNAHQRRAVGSRRLLGPDAVEQIAGRLVRWLELPSERRAEASQALSDLARERFSWEGVARGAIDAAHGRLDALPLP